MNALGTWLKAQSPDVQRFIYAVETGVATALTIFLASLYAALSSKAGLAGFDWHGQLTTLELGAGAAIVKALLDYIKGVAPTQIIEPKGP